MFKYSIIIILLTGLFTGPAQAGSLLNRYVPEHTRLSQSIVQIFLNGERDSSVLGQVSRLRLLEMDLLNMGFQGNVIALETTNSEDVPRLLFLRHAGLDEIYPSDLLSGQSLQFVADGDLK